MSSRGRGRGNFSNKVLTEKLGVQKNEMVKEPNSGPPEIFPPLQFRPIMLPDERSLERSYMLIKKKELIDFFKNSQYNISLDSAKPNIERYSDRLRFLTDKPPLNLPWNLFPKELNPNASTTIKRKIKREKKKLSPNVNVSAAKVRKISDAKGDVEKKLEELEKKEETEIKKEPESEGDEEEEEIIEQEGEVDEEMDEGTDYINSYFDNGEDYLEDDNDGGDEGGVF